MAALRRLAFIRLYVVHIGRAAERLRTRAVLFSGWTWIAAGSLVGFEAFDLIFATVALMPEMLPVILLGLALAWVLRKQLRRAWARLRARWRLARMRRRAW